MRDHRKIHPVLDKTVHPAIRLLGQFQASLFRPVEGFARVSVTQYPLRIAVTRVGRAQQYAPSFGSFIYASQLTELSSLAAHSKPKLKLLLAVVAVWSRALDL